MLETVPDTWSWLDAIAGPLDDDFVEAVQEQPLTTERPDFPDLLSRA